MLKKKKKITKVEVSWVVTPFRVVVGYQRFSGPCCLHLHPGHLKRRYPATTTTRRHNPEEFDLNHHRRKNLKCLKQHMFNIYSILMNYNRGIASTYTGKTQECGR